MFLYDLFRIFYIECIEGWYGVNCSLQCKGHCRGGTTCNHVTGLCERGCADGWTGSMCEKGIHGDYFFFQMRASCISNL